jgi:hypothetical protein
MGFNFEKVYNILNEAFKNDGIQGLKSSYIIAINSALDSDYSVEEIKAIKAVYDKLHHDWEKSINIVK